MSEHKLSLHDIERHRLDGGDRYQHCCCYFDQDDDEKQMTECNHHKETRNALGLAQEKIKALELQVMHAENEGYDAAKERIEHLEAALRETPCKVLLLQETPYNDCFPLEPCEPCHCGRSLLAGDTALNICEWFDDDGWHSGCGKDWEFIYDGPNENGLKFCLYCGKPVTVEDTGS